MKKIVFLTGTRADFGKLKSLIKITQESDQFEVHIFVTGMHMNTLYGFTVDEIYKSGFNNIYKFINHDSIVYMDRTLAKTVDGFSLYIAQIKPDLIIVHGDRLEAMAGAIVGSFNNIMVAHIEGGEISGTIDESIRHAVSKLAHIHFVANNDAKKRLIQLGEFEDSIYVIGSPDLDLMNPLHLPPIEKVLKYYNIELPSYAIAMFHPVTTEFLDIQNQIKSFVDALIESQQYYIIVFPNNDLGSVEILREYKRLANNANFRIFPSLRFEYFLTLLKSANFIIGNSSAGIREAPFYNIPTIDIGSRQNNRASLPTIYHATYEKDDILRAIIKVNSLNIDSSLDIEYFGQGRSNQLFIELLSTTEFWKISHQKQFQELK